MISDGPEQVGTGDKQRKEGDEQQHNQQHDFGEFDQISQ
jgi:hypothetical protein